MKLLAEPIVCAVVALDVIFMVGHHVSAWKHITPPAKDDRKMSVEGGKKAKDYVAQGFFADVVPEAKLSEDMFGDEHDKYYKHSEQKVSKGECQKDDSTKEKLNELVKEMRITRERLIRCKANLSDYKIEEAKLIADVVKSVGKLLINRTAGPNSVVKVELVFTREQEKLFHRINEFPFVPEREIHHAFQVLLKILEGANFTEYVHVPPEKVYFFESLVLGGVVMICILFTVGLLFQLRLGISMQRIILLIFLSGIIVSVPWEWYRLYKEALAVKLTQQERLKSKNCNPELLSTFESVKLWFTNTFMFGEDECLKYHKSILVDPSLEVSPIKAISSTITTSIITPLAMAFEGIGRSFNLLMKDIPLQWQIPVFLAILFVLVIVVFSVFGMDIRFLFAKLTIGGQLFWAARVGEEDFRLEIQRLNRALENKNHQLEALQTHNAQILRLLPPNRGEVDGAGQRAILEAPTVLHSGVEDVIIQEEEPAPGINPEAGLLLPIPVSEDAGKEPTELLFSLWNEDNENSGTLSSSDSYVKIVPLARVEKTARSVNVSSVPESSDEDKQSLTDDNARPEAQESSWTN